MTVVLTYLQFLYRRFLGWMKYLLYKITTMLAQIKPSLFVLRMLPANSFQNLQMNDDNTVQVGEQKQLHLIEPPKPKFKPSDIVYLLFHPEYGARLPYIGSDREIDCKILRPHDVNDYREYNFHYALITGHGVMMEGIPENAIIPASQYLHHVASSSFTLNEDTELAPKGTKFYTMGNWVVSADRSIMIDQKRFETISKLFI